MLVAQLEEAEEQATRLLPFAGYATLPCVTTTWAKEADTWCAEGLPEHCLMLRAGVACGKWLESHTDAKERLCICCGAGNNGGDGLVAAAWLKCQGRRVAAQLIAEPATFDAAWALRLARACGVAVTIHAGRPDEAEVYVDALIGRGLTGPLRQPVAGLVEQLRQSGRLFASIDMPTGWNGDETPQLQILAMLAVDPELGRPQDEILYLDAGWLASAWFADLGVEQRLRTFDQAQWLAPVAG